MNKSLLLIIFILTPFQLISKNFLLPKSFNLDSEIIKSVYDIDFRISSVPNIDSLLNWENNLNNSDNDYPSFYGMPQTVNYDLKHLGSWDTLSNGDKIWRLNIICPGAYSVNIVFEDLYIGENSHLSFYNEEKDYLLGPYTERINKKHGIYSTHLIFGQSTIVELFEPKIEELTLYVIQLKKENDEIKKELNEAIK